MKKLSALDLNLLSVFLSLYRHGQVTRAAKELGLTQPAISHALRRLRDALGDPLFVKIPGKMEATPRAHRLAPVVEQALGALEAAAFPEEAFAPGRIRRTFHIRTTDLVETLLFPKLNEILRREAPNARLSFQPLFFELPAKELTDGSCDLAIAGFFGDIPAGFYRQRLYDDGFLSCTSERHPKKRWTLDSFCEAEHLLIAPGGELSSAMDMALKKLRKKRNVVSGAGAYLAALWETAQSELVFTGPRRLVEPFADIFKLRTFPCPVELKNYEVVQAWHGRNHADEEHRWFRECVRRCLQE